MINKIIRNFIAKQMAGRSDDGIMITLKDPQRVTLGENILADTLMRYGIDPAAITSEAQLKTILQQIKNTQAAEIRDAGIRNTTSAKIFNIEGQKLDPNKPIIGGTQTGKELSPELSKRLSGTEVERIKQKIADKKIDDDLPPPGSRGGKDDIAAPVQSSEESLRDMIVAENKKNIDKMKRKKMLDEAIDNVSPSLTGDRKYDADVVAADLAERMGLVYDDMPVKERIKLYDEAYTGLTKKKFDPPEEKADGGRIGLRSGTGFKFLQRVFGKEGFKEMKSRDPEMYQGLLEVVDMYRKRDKEGLKMYLQKFLPHMDDEEIEAFIIGSDGSEGLVGELIRLGSGRDYKGKLEMIKRSEEMKKLRDLEVTDDMIRKPNADGGIMRLGFKDGPSLESILENDPLKDGVPMKKDGFFISPDFSKMTPEQKELYKLRMEIMKKGFEKKLSPEGLEKLKIQRQIRDQQRKDRGLPESIELMADGGRIGFKDGMNRRTFLKLLGGAMSIPIIGKVFKPFKVGKTVTKVPIIKTDNVPGKPEWFDQLVNKVIIEGDEVTKRFATKDREIVHMKKLDEDTTVRVTQDLDEGAVRVEYESPENTYGDPVSLRYKKPNPDEGDPRPTAQFDVAESGPVGRADGPDDYSIEIDEVGGEGVRDIYSDVSKLKQYATGKKPTLKEIVQIKKRKDKAARISEGGEGEMQAVIDRQGEYDYSPDDGMASGGIARMLGE